MVLKSLKPKELPSSHQILFAIKGIGFLTRFLRFIIAELMSKCRGLIGELILYSVRELLNCRINFVEG